MKIVFFNHKGGVSKTTSAFSIGYKLAQNGHRVMLVDGDPQCNLTAMVMQDNFVDFYSNLATKNQNIKDGVEPAFSGSPIPISTVECFVHPSNNNLFLLAGHPNLTELEPPLSFAQTAPGAFSTLQNLPGAFNALISNTANHHNIEYILVDLNPGLSAINQNLFSISDMFLIPTNPDPFSLMALDTLSTLFPRWQKIANDMKTSFAGSTYPFPDTNPKLGGTIINRFNVRNGSPARAFRNTIEEIEAKVQQEFAPALGRAGMLFRPEVYVAADISDTYTIATIPDFQSLQPHSQQNGVPVFALRDDQMGAGGVVLENLQRNRAVFDDLFDEIVRRIEMIKANA